MELREQLAERMARPQRHRLLQGYPAVPAMVRAVPEGERRGQPGLVRQIDGAVIDQAYAQAQRSLLRLSPSVPGLTVDQQAQVEKARARAAATVAEGDRSTEPLFEVDRSRGLIIGVIPHTQCVPRQEACGFCTFPHDAAHEGQRGQMVDAVAAELDQLGAHPSLQGREVEAIYLGGGTANLSSTDQVSQLLRILDLRFNIRDAELTLEGVPAFFDHWLSSHLKNLAKQPVAQRRISLGIQTFDPGFLLQMGRERFGDAKLVKKLVAKARGLELTTSGDLLYGLPGQTAAQMDADVEDAIACGLDQICLYNLVLFEGLGTPWSKDPALLAKCEPPESLLEHWLRLSERLRREGYRQNTVTNFEREEVGHRRFRYEVASFSPDRYDALGVGPLSLSTFLDLPRGRGLKLLRRKDLGRPAWSGEDLAFEYDADDLRRLFVVRSLAKVNLELSTYARIFGRSLTEDFGPALQALTAAGLVQLDPQTLALTPTGAFYSDAVVGLLAADGRRPGAGLHTRDLLADRPMAAAYYAMG
jgi:oxygen-independent coproporphyrinogen-3 oxidase